MNYTFPEFQNYIKELCIAHTEVMHQDGTRRAFIRFPTNEDVQSIAQHASDVMVVVNYFTGRGIGEVDEGKLQQVASLLFLVNCAPGDDPYDEMEAAQVKANSIMFDFWARLKKDYEDDSCGPLQYLQPELMTYEPVDGPVLENYYGWQMDIPFKVTAPCYNPEKWIDND